MKTLNTSLHIKYSVKFRAFGITFGTVEGSKFVMLLPFGIPIPLDLTKPVVNDRGVTIWIVLS